MLNKVALNAFGIHNRSSLARLKHGVVPVRSCTWVKSCAQVESLSPERLRAQWMEAGPRGAAADRHWASKRAIVFGCLNQSADLEPDL